MAPATSPATPAINTAFCVAEAAATPTIKLAVEDAVVGPEYRRSQPADTVDEVPLRKLPKRAFQYSAHHIKFDQAALESFQVSFVVKRPRMTRYSDLIVDRYVASSAAYDPPLLDAATRLTAPHKTIGADLAQY